MEFAQESQSKSVGYKLLWDTHTKSKLAQGSRMKNTSIFKGEKDDYGMKFFFKTDKWLLFFIQYRK